MTARQRLLLAGFTVLGLGAATTSAVVHYRLMGDPGYTSFCDVNSTVSCTEAYLSPWGALFGVPVAVLGVLWFVAVALLLGAERAARRAVAESIPGYVFVLSVVGLGFVAYLAYGAFFVLKTICMMCLLTYVAVVGIFLVSSAATRFPMSTLPSRAARDLKTMASSPVAIAMTVVFLVAAVSAIAFFPKEAGAAGGAGQAPLATPASSLTPEQRARIEQQFDQSPRAIVPVDPDGAAVLVVKFHDYQCPPCGRTYEDYKPILAHYAKQNPGKVKLVEKDFPIEAECNPNTPTGGHLAACEAAAAARMARDKGEAIAAKMSDWLYANQSTLTPMSVREGARIVAGITDFDGRYQAMLQQVKIDASLGGLLQVRSTPTFFINGVKIDGGLPPPVFDAIIAHELKKAAK